MAKLSPKTQEKIRDLAGRFPHKRSAVIPAIHYAQAEIGYLEDDALQEIADLLELPRNMTTEVVSFYTMFDRDEKGRYKIEVCRNLSCALMGNLKMLEHLQERLGIRVGETTADGKFTLQTSECLGACGYAPMMQIGAHYYEHLDRESLGAILDALSRDELPPVAPAGYLEKDQVKPAPAADRAIPTSSQGIRDHLVLGAPESQKEAVE